ncbi:MAG: helix-turn-helix transcriptional regulator [Candidatus Eremiobacteraeota bacterium]|nr:helix-turn-helix transcriptional regulator [Candidatus Eremiobacteraeota bacterium]
MNPGRAKSIYTAEYKRLRELLKRSRIDADLTQAEVAERLGRPQSFVAKIESGERRLDVVELLQVLRKLGTDPLVFFSHFLRPRK